MLKYLQPLFKKKTLSVQDIDLKIVSFGPNIFSHKKESKFKTTYSSILANNLTEIILKVWLQD